MRLAARRGSNTLPQWGHREAGLLGGQSAIINFGFQGTNCVVERHNFLFFGAQATNCNCSILKLTLTDRKLDGHLGDAVFANLV